MNITRTFARAALVPVVGVTVFLGAGAASAHVTVSGTSTAAGSSSVLTFSVGHGCDGSATNRIAIQMPEDIVAVTPDRQPFYNVEKKMEKLVDPITDSHGNEITERVAQVIFTATTPLPEGQRDTFDLSVNLPEAAGETVAFPTIQTCEKGETAWTEVAAEGKDSDDLESPAPTLTVTAAAEGDGHGHDEAEGTETKADEAKADDEGGNALAISGLVAGILGLLAGGVALARQRK